MESSQQSGPWGIPDRDPIRLGFDLDQDTFRSASYASGSFFSQVSGTFASEGSSSASLSRSLRSTYVNEVPARPCMERKLQNARRMSADPRTENSGFHMIIPTKKSDICVDWGIVVANQYLIKHGKPHIRRKNTTILDFNVEDCKSSVGDFSSTFKIYLALKPNNSEAEEDIQTFNFIAKFLPLEDPLRVYVFETDIFRKESQMYFDVLPAIKGCLRFMARRRIGQLGQQSEQSCRSLQWTEYVDEVIPDCIYSSYNPDGVGVLVFKSCTDDGYRHDNNPEGFSLPQTLRVVKAMAKFHAAAKTLLKIRGLDLIKQVYPGLTRDMLSGETMLPEVKAHLETYSEFLNTVSSFPRGAAPVGVTLETCLEMKNQFEKLRSANLLRLLAGTCRHGPPQLTTIIHGELWEHNIFFTPDHCHIGDGVKVIDWKNAKIGSAMLDLAFLLLSSTDHIQRSESLSHILQTYHETFTSTYQEMVPEAEMITFEALQEEYHECLRYALLQCVIMFVLELQFIDSNMAEEKEGTKLETLGHKLCAYENRALNLFRGIDLGHFEEERSPNESPSRSHSHRQIPTFQVDEPEDGDRDSDLEILE